MSEEYTPLVDYPDYTQEFAISAVLVDMIPVSIKAQTIDKIRIDIVAQSIGNIAVDIAAQTVGNITVDIAAQSVGNLAVDIAAQSLSTIAISINAADVTGNIPIDIAAQTLSNVSVDIAAQTVGNLAVDIAAQTLSTLKIDIAAQTLSQVDVNIAASAVTLNVNITGSTATVDVNISAQTVNLNVKTATGEKVDIWNLPAPTTRRSTALVNVPAASEVSLYSYSGKGRHEYSLLESDYGADIQFNIYVDGVLADVIDPNTLNSAGAGPSTPKVSLLSYNATGMTWVLVSVEYNFETSFEIRAQNNSATLLHHALVNTSILNVFT